ncbi:MAG: putative amidophosphoribosyltransferase [Bradymonadia bacterium]
MAHPAAKCPFCSGEIAGVNCVSCGTDITAPRTVCKGCGTLKLSSSKSCEQCGTLHRSEMTWKIPLIIGMFIIVIIINVALALFG